MLAPTWANFIAIPLALPTFTHCMPSPQDSPELRGRDAVESTLSSNYVAAWAEVLQTTITPKGDIAPNALTPRGTYPGQAQYVAIAYHKKRWVISLVAVLEVRNRFPDAMASSSDIATAIANNARHIVGDTTGKWSSVSWGFFSDIRANAVTVVAKNLMQKSVHREVALKAAKKLAEAWGLSTTIVWKYPQNGNLKRQVPESDGTTFEIISAFQPTVRLADELIARFHRPDVGALKRRRQDESGEKGRRDDNERGKCKDYVDFKDRLLFGHVPWNTIYDAGCWETRDQLD